MSLLNTMKGWGKGRAANDNGANERAFDEMYPNGAADLPLEMTSPAGTAAANMMNIGPADSSIISESSPTTEAPAEFGDTRSPAAQAAAQGGTALPLIGGLPMIEQQRILIGLIVTGLLLLALMIAVTLGAANRSASQVGASGQSLMQSQRLAKSVTQALVGRPEAFPEVRESVDVLATTVRGLKNGDEMLEAAPPPAQPAIDAVLPLVDKAEKNANIIIGQQKVLTQVGEALRTINRQSSDLLETAETIYSMKLQQNATPPS